MKDFPFEAVYEHMAKPIVTLGLNSQIMPPMLFSVLVHDGIVVSVRELSSIAPFFESGAGKDKLGMLIRELMTDIGDKVRAWL